MAQPNVIVGPELERIIQDKSLGELLVLLLQTHENTVLQVFYLNIFDLP